MEIKYQDIKLRARFSEINRRLFRQKTSVLRNIIFSLVLLFPAYLQAGMFDDLVNKAKQVTEQAVDQAVNTVNSVSEDKQESAAHKAPVPNSIEKAPSTPQTKAISGQPATSTSDDDSIISIQDIPSGRRPATPATLALARLRYDQGWLTKTNLLQSTELSIACQQFFLKYSGIRGNGCMGEYLRTGKTLHYIRLAPVFSNAEIENRNPKFAAQEFTSRMKMALLDLAQHLPPKFGDTVAWRGTYDFDQGTLNIKINGYEPAARNIVNRLPQSVRHLDLRNPRRANFDGTAGEYYRLGVQAPYVDGVNALAFDRDLNNGQIKISAAQAEKLFQGTSNNIVMGTAVVEFTVGSTAGEAAAATLEQIKIWPLGQKAVDLHQTPPFMTLPTSAFPKLEPSEPKAKVKTKPSVITADKPAANVESTSEPDPFYRVAQGKSYGPDILGLQLGMTLAETDKIIRSHKSPKDIIQGQSTTPFAQMRLYVLEPGDEAIAISTLNTPAGERVAAITRTVYFNPDSAPTQIAIIASLEKKYGKAFYEYDANNMQSERRWLSNWKGEALTQESAYAQHIDKCERGAYRRSSLDVWRKKDGKPYLWYLPWLKERAGGSLSAHSPGDPKRIKKPSRCGPVLIGQYASDGGQLTGSSLTLNLFDTAWIIDAQAKRIASEKTQGAKDLAL